MALQLRLQTGSDLTLDREKLTIVRKFDVVGKLPFTGGGDAFDYVSSLVMGLIKVTYPTYGTPMGTLFWNSIQLHEEFYAQKYSCSVTYSPFDKKTGTYQISVDQATGNQHITAGRLIETYATADANKRPQGGSIGVDGDEIKGCEIPIAEDGITVQFRHPQAFLNRSYIRAVGRLRGYPNADPFMGYEPGEVMYMNGQMTETECEASASYTFRISENKTNFEVAGITIVDKKGWDVLSSYYEPAVNTNVGGKDHPQRKPISFDVVRPREWKDYASVFGWGGT